MRGMKQEGCIVLEIQQGRMEADLQHLFSSGSSRPPTVDHDEEMTLESPRKRQGGKR